MSKCDNVNYNYTNINNLEIMILFILFELVSML